MKFFLVALLLAVPVAFAHEIDFSPHVGARVPADLVFREAPFAGYLGKAPVVLVLGYFGCVNLCGTTLTGVSEALRDTGLRADSDYLAVFASVDPRDEIARPESRVGWHFLTGARAAATLASTVGFEYAYESDSGEFAHPAGFVVLTPDGTIARYFMGVRFEAALLKTAIEDAAGGRASSAFERLLLVCFHDPLIGRNSNAVMIAMRVAMAGFLVLLGWLAWRRWG